MPEVIEKECSCPSCINYQKCKAIEQKYGDYVLHERGNWRIIFENGRRVGTPARRCTEAIFKQNKDKFIGKKVLEIGCGPLSEINEEFCRTNKVEYYGLDPNRLPNSLKSDSSFLGVRQQLNKHQCYIRDYFPSTTLHGETFDLLYGNSTIEHWHENEEDLDRSIDLYKKDIQGCFNALNSGGIMFMYCPIYIHGNYLFMTGKVDVIKDIFQSVNWSKIIFEYWRRDHGDLMPYCPDSRKDFFKKNFAIDLTNMWLLNVIGVR